MCQTQDVVPSAHATLRRENTLYFSSCTILIQGTLLLENGTLSYWKMLLQDYSCILVVLSVVERNRWDPSSDLHLKPQPTPHSPSMPCAQQVPMGKLARC